MQYYTLFGKILCDCNFNCHSCRSAIGLSITVNYYRIRGTIAVGALILLRGKFLIKNEPDTYAIF